MRKALLLVLLILAGCADPYTVFDSRTGEPLLLIRRASSYEECLDTMRAESERLGVTYRYVHVKGSRFGQSLLWPFEQGYACEAAIGPVRPPSGAYPNVPPQVPHG